MTDLERKEILLQILEEWEASQKDFNALPSEEQALLKNFNEDTRKMVEQAKKDFGYLLEDNEADKT